MGIRFKFGRMTPLLSDEMVLHSQRRFRAISARCPPGYRIGFQLPPIMLNTLYVTNRRILLACNILLFSTQEIDIWFEGEKPDDKVELITDISVANGLFGRCLEIRSQDPSRCQCWLCSPDLTLRLFFKNPEQVEAVIRKAMTEAAQKANRS